MEPLLTIYDGKKRQRIPISEIEYLAGLGNYTYVHIRNQPPILVSLTLKKMAGRLPGFLRIHKTTLVNASHIIGHNIQKSQDSIVLLSNDRTLAVSRRRSNLVKQQLCKP
ncbi:hypothetical protein GCM10028805_22500 [Spirosoma harenae]